MLQIWSVVGGSNLLYLTIVISTQKAGNYVAYCHWCFRKVRFLSRSRVKNNETIKSQIPVNWIPQLCVLRRSAAAQADWED